MRIKWKRWGVGLLGWLIGPQTVVGAVTALIGFVLAKLADLPAAIVFLIVLLALIAGLALAHLGLSFYERLKAQRSVLPDPESGPCGDPARRLRELRKGAHQLAWNLQHFPNWWSAVKDENFSGKLPDDYGPVTHEKAMEILSFMFGQFFSAAWSYQTFCPSDPHRAEVKALVDEVYNALGMPRDTGGLPDDRIGSTQLHVIGRLSTARWGEPDSRPFDEVGFRAVLKQEADDFEPLQAFLRKAGPDTAARARLEAAVRR